jgi:hypothetical protein
MSRGIVSISLTEVGDMKYQNIHTKEVLWLHSKDTERDGERTIEIYILEDGSRWDATHFLANWKLVQ